MDTRGVGTCKLTLAECLVYKPYVLVSDFEEGEALLLGTDFLTRAGIIINLREGIFDLPDGVMIPIHDLEVSPAPEVRELEATHCCSLHPERANEDAVFEVPQVADDEELWVRSVGDWVFQTIELNYQNRPIYISDILILILKSTTFIQEYRLPNTEKR